jgi:hypothetical protein
VVVPGAEGEGGGLEHAVDALYAADPDGFVAARDRLASELRREGRRDEAHEVARLRRPTLAAWAVDHVALQSPERIDALVAAGERLRRAHEEAVSGGDRRALQRAAEQRRTLVASLADQALDALLARGSGYPDAHREGIEATLEAASTDADVAALVRRGRLVAPLPRPAGFTGLLDLTAPAGTDAGPRTPEAVEDGGLDAEALERTREEAARLERLAAEAQDAAASAHRAAEEAAAVVKRLEGELSEARARAVAATEEARQAHEQAARRTAAAAAERRRRRDVE